MVEVQRDQAGDRKCRGPMNVAKQVRGVVQLVAIAHGRWCICSGPPAGQPVQVLGDAAGIVSGGRKGQCAIEESIDGIGCDVAVLDQTNQFGVHPAKILVGGNGEVELVTPVRSVVAEFHFDDPACCGQTGAEVGRRDRVAVHSCPGAVRGDPVRWFGRALNEKSCVATGFRAMDQGWSRDRVRNEGVFP